MPISSIVENLISNTTGPSLDFFCTELVLSATIVLMLLVRLFSLDRWVPTAFVAMTGAIVALLTSVLQYNSPGDGSVSLTFFTGLLVQDQFAVYFRVFLSLFLLLTITLTVLTGIPDNEDGPDFYSLVIGATIGMMIMAAANNLLMLFIGIEMASVPSYAMVAFLKGRKVSSEAALKYVVYGAGTAGVMLYGLSLVAGVLGTGDMSLVGERIAAITGGEAAGLGNPAIRTLALGMMFLLVGVAFKLSLVPFHFWCPDAFEGASAEVAGFLSVASKAGAFALLVRFCIAFSGNAAAGPLMTAFGIGLGVVAMLTATFGNLAAYGQKNVKRLLAYSTIAHAGYMLMGVAAMLVMLNSEQSADLTGEVQGAIGGLLYYLSVYLFMNLGAFAVVALLRNSTFSEELDSYRGVFTQCPWVCVAMVICVFSLIGLPPFGGFLGKLMIFGSALKAGQLHWSMYVMVVVGGLNTVFSLIYYLNILKVMIIDERPADAAPVRIPAWDASYTMLLAVVVFCLGAAPLLPGGVSSIAQDAAASAVETPVQPVTAATAANLPNAASAAELPL